MIVCRPDFLQRAIEPELIADGNIALLTSIRCDQKSNCGYFLQIPPDETVVRVRYRDSLEAVLEERFTRKMIRPLDQYCIR